MSARGKWFITPHAVHQYIKRVHPELTYREAQTVLIRLSELARKVKELEPSLWLYRGPKPERVRCLVAEAKAEGELPQLVTLYQGKDPEWRTMPRTMPKGVEQP
jgi:hypothetical protein